MTAAPKPPPLPEIDASLLRDIERHPHGLKAGIAWGLSVLMARRASPSPAPAPDVPPNGRQGPGGTLVPPVYVVGYAPSACDNLRGVCEEYPCCPCGRAYQSTKYAKPEPAAQDTADAVGEALRYADVMCQRSAYEPFVALSVLRNEVRRQRDENERLKELVTNYDDRLRSAGGPPHEKKLGSP